MQFLTAVLPIHTIARLTMAALLATACLLPAMTCGGTEHSAAPAPFSPHESGQLLSLEGSNTLGEHLAKAWARGYLAAKGATDISTRAGALPHEYEVTGIYRGRAVWLSIKAHGSATGFAGLARGSANLAMSSRPIKTAELRNLAHLGALTSAEGEHIVAIDGLAVITHPDNPVHTLSVSQIRALFSGAIGNWSLVGGRDAPVSVYARDHNSGTYDTFNRLILAGARLNLAAQRFESNDELSNMVALDPGAIGFVGLASIGNARALAVQDGAAAPMLPTRLTVATEDYPLARRLYLYTPVNNVNPFAGEFVQYTQSAVGQAAVDRVGFVAQTPMVTPQVVIDGPQFYRALAQVAERLSVNFRFQPDRAELDNKAVRDVERLAEFMRRNTNVRIQLVGFSDGSSDDDTARLLSKLRASKVKVELFRYGIVTAPIAGFGAVRKVAEDSARGRRNDRVEVWVYHQDQSAIINALHSPRPDPTRYLASW